MSEKPTAEDFEAYSRVSMWFRQENHRLEVERGRYELHFSSDGATVSTEYGEEPMTDELWVQLGWTPIDGGWAHGGES